jgi:regulator of protease activity HflC (stomatin/prohibitin superfamily)
VRTDEKTLDMDRAFWATGQNGRLRGGELLNVRTDGYLLTGDANIVHMKLRARYRVRNDVASVLSYELGANDPELILRRALAASTCNVVGSMGVMEVIKREQDLFGRIQKELDSRLARYERETGAPLGIEVVKIEAIEAEGIKNPTEPIQVTDAFNKAQMAESEKDQLVRQGETEATKIVSAAMSEAERVRAEARANAVRLVTSAQADAQTIQQILPFYQQSAAVARILRLMYQQRTMEDVMAQAPGAFVLYRSPPGSRREIRLLHQRRSSQTETSQGQQPKPQG